MKQNTSPSKADTLASVNSRALADIGGYQPERVGSAPQPPAKSNNATQPKK